MKNLSITCSCGASMEVQNLYDDEMRLLIDKFHLAHKNCQPKVNTEAVLLALARIETAIRETKLTPIISPISSQLCV